MIRTRSMERILDPGYAATKIRAIRLRKLLRIRSLAVTDPRISASQSTPNPDSVLRSSMEKR